MYCTATVSTAKYTMWINRKTATGYFKKCSEQAHNSAQWVVAIDSLLLGFAI